MTKSNSQVLKEEIEKILIRALFDRGYVVYWDNPVPEIMELVKQAVKENDEMWEHTLKGEVECAVKEEREKRIRFAKRMKLEFDACICQCGEKWSETDGADLVKEELDTLNK